MQKKVKIIRVLCVLIFFVFVLFLSDLGLERVIDETLVPMDVGGTKIVADFCDNNVIPDKYNTGAVKPKNGYIKVEADNSYEGIKFRSGGSTKLTLEFMYSNKSIEGEYVFDGYDFSDSGLTLVNEMGVDRKIKIIFKNCLFKKFTNSRTKTNVSFEFNNCTLESITGSNVVLNRCKVGGSYSDAINPYCNFEVNDCYVSDLSYPLENGIIHTDGVQIAGFTDIEVYNVHFNNCRFEIPQLACATSNCYINSCIMLSLERSNAKNMSFKNCYLNGGGYSIYACAKSYLTIEDTYFENINIGCMRRYKGVVGDVAEGVTMKQVKDTDSLYVSTVSRSREKNQTTLSVTNDTNIERQFIVFGSSGKQYEYKIKECPLASQKGQTSIDEFPFDVKFTIPEYLEWMVVFEKRESGYRQIRYVNWSDEEVLYSIDDKKSILKVWGANSNQLSDCETGKEAVKNDTSSEKCQIISEGKCGKNVEYALTSDGVLLLEGDGSTYNYSSKSESPWSNYREDISEIQIDEGITKIGTQLFLKCSNVEYVSIPKGVQEIGGNAFMGCKKLEVVEVPSSVENIGSFAFWNVGIKEVKYDGTDEERKNMVIGNYNHELISSLTEQSDEKLIAEGTCGREVNWKLLENGCLLLEGSGNTYSYASNRLSPWSEYGDKITTVTISDKIIVLGNQLFLKCKNLKDVKIGSDVVTIGGNVFMGCSSLEKISIPRSLISVGSYAFNGTSLKTINYTGTAEEWKKVEIGAKNLPLEQANIICR